MAKEKLIRIANIIRLQFTFLSRKRWHGTSRLNRTIWYMSNTIKKIYIYIYIYIIPDPFNFLDQASRQRPPLFLFNFYSHLTAKTYKRRSNFPFVSDNQLMSPRFFFVVHSFISYTGQKFIVSHWLRKKTLWRDHDLFKETNRFPLVSHLKSVI